MATAVATAKSRPRLHRYSLVVMGASLGGLEAVEAILKSLPERFPLPLALVQHREREADDSLCTLLRRRCLLPVREVEDKEPIVPGTVHIAPANYHLLVEKGNFALSTEAPIHFARPSLDALFESAADACGEGVIGVILTGSNQDGAEGARAIKARGGFLIVQDPSLAQSPVMPKAAIAAADADKILPIEDIGPLLVTLADTVGRVTPRGDGWRTRSAGSVTRPTTGNAGSVTRPTTGNAGSVTRPTTGNAGAGDPADNGERPVR